MQFYILRESLSRRHLSLDAIDRELRSAATERKRGVPALKQRETALIRDIRFSVSQSRLMCNVARF